MIRNLSVAWIATLALAFFISSCSNTDSLVPEYMTVSPQSLVFAPSDTLHTIAMTHSCTCPISWTIAPDTTAHWLTVATSYVGDIGSFPVKIDRTKLTQDTSRAFLQISTNDYKTQGGNTFDTVSIVVYR